MGCLLPADVEDAGLGLEHFGDDPRVPSTEQGLKVTRSWSWCVSVLIGAVSREIWLPSCPGHEQ